jgi:DNA invertase Pin-like site-specific DNA recombinase
MSTSGCHDVLMPLTPTPTHEDLFRRIKEVRAQAIEHTRLARRLAVERRDLMRALMDEGVSRADIARELGVSRQAVQKMLAC